MKQSDTALLSAGLQTAQIEQLSFTGDDLYQILQAMPSAVLMVDQAGRIALANAQAEKLFGYRSDEMIGQSFEMLMPERYRGGHGALFRSYHAHPANRPMGTGRDLQGVRSNGSEFQIEIGLNSLHMKQGHFVLATIVDISERKRAELMLRNKNEELKTFAYTVSHDLKAPLRGITGYAQELERRFKEALPERGQFCVAQILTASANLDQLIEDLLKYSRIDSDQPTSREVNLADIVNSILKDRQHTLTETETELSVDIPPLTLITWERGLQQVLTNLIDNAIKYSHKSQPPRLAITGEVQGGICRVIVTDNGIGFDMKYHDRIFGLFNRLVRASEFEGTGAGLAIVKKVVEKIGGSIRAESAVGQGASFILELPINHITEQAR